MTTTNNSPSPAGGLICPPMFEPDRAGEPIPVCPTHREKMGRSKFGRDGFFCARGEHPWARGGKTASLRLTRRVREALASSATVAEALQRLDALKGDVPSAEDGDLYDTQRWLRAWAEVLGEEIPRRNGSAAGAAERAAPASVSAPAPDQQPAPSAAQAAPAPAPNGADVAALAASLGIDPATLQALLTSLRPQQPQQPRAGQARAGKSR